jgi:hypothetical protein
MLPSDEIAENKNEIDESNLGHVLTKSVTMFALQTRKENVLPKSTSRCIITVSLFETYFENICSLIVARLELNGIDVSTDPSLNTILKDPEIIEEVWSNVDSDAKLKRYCIQHLDLVEPI